MEMRGKPQRLGQSLACRTGQIQNTPFGGMYAYAHAAFHNSNSNYHESNFYLGLGGANPAPLRCASCAAGAFPAYCLERACLVKSHVTRAQRVASILHKILDMVRPLCRSLLTKRDWDGYVCHTGKRGDGKA
jgi:hypothetical protein